ncbi:hypothetical protein BDZ89DRAFT_1135616 [Hymenopellis radicata]|nr:hypothetical protein BDZ89DRAFT_1135616 [Hymenopellis radicata]
MLETVFERSLPLVFDYSLSSSSRAQAIDIVRSHSLRWHSVTLSSSPDFFIRQLGGVGPLPLLVTVALRITDWVGFRPKKSTLPQIGHFIFTTGRPDPTTVCIPWHQLTHLEHSLWSSTFLLDCQLLLHCPHLQSYITHTRKEPGSSDAVAHSKLKFLDIEHVALLRYLQCTSLTELKIDTGSIDYVDDEEVEGYTSSLRTFLANSPMLTSISVQAPSSSRSCPFILTFTSPTIQSLTLDITGNHDDLVPLVASATPLLVPHMTYLDCTSSRFLANTALLVQTLFAVIQSRWRVERGEVAKLQSVRLFFGYKYRAGGDEDSDELGRMIDSLRVFKEEGLDVVVFQEFPGVDKPAQRLL